MKYWLFNSFGVTKGKYWVEWLDGSRDYYANPLQRSLAIVERMTC